MTELAELLELLYRAGESWRTARATVRQWHHLPRGEQAMRRVQEARGGSARMMMVGYGGTADPPETHETLTRVWIEKPDRAREERDEGQGAMVSVRDGDTWWMYHSDWGVQTNDGDPSHQASVGQSAGPLLDPAPLIGCLAFDGIEGDVVRARPRGVREPHSFGLHELGLGADEYELVVDRERGFLRRATAFTGGEPFHVLELLEVAFDEEFPPDTFTFEPPEGVRVRKAGAEVEPTTLEEAAERSPFTVFAPAEVPADWRLHVVFFEDGPFSPSVHLHYSSRQAAHSLLVQESASDGRDPMQGFPWEERDGLLVWEPERRSEPVHVRVERDGTRITLSSQDLPLGRLTELAHSLEPA